MYLSTWIFIKSKNPHKLQYVYVSVTDWHPGAVNIMLVGHIYSKIQTQRYERERPLLSYKLANWITKNNKTVVWPRTCELSFYSHWMLPNQPWLLFTTLHIHKIPLIGTSEWRKGLIGNLALQSKKHLQCTQNRACREMLGLLNEYNCYWVWRNRAWFFWRNNEATFL